MQQQGRAATTMQHASARPINRRQAISSSVGDISDIIRRQGSPRGLAVIEILPQAVAREFRDERVTPQSLGIHPRDLSLFQSGGRVANQRATLAVRDDVIFIRTEAVGLAPHCMSAVTITVALCSGLRACSAVWVENAGSIYPCRIPPPRSGLS